MAVEFIKEGGPSHAAFQSGVELSTIPNVTPDVSLPPLTPVRQGIFTDPPAEAEASSPHVQYATVRLAAENNRYIRVPRRPDGTTVLDHQPSDVELYDVMLGRIEPGLRRFRDYPYDVYILPSGVGFFHERKDAVGNRVVLAEVYLLGEHHANGVGERIPGDNAWSKVAKRDANGNPIFEEIGEGEAKELVQVFEDETRAFVSFSHSPWDPGVVHARLLRRDDMSGDFSRAKATYDRETRDEVNMQRMKGKVRDVYALREQRIQEVLEREAAQESVYVNVGD